MRFCTYSYILLATTVVEIVCMYDGSREPLPIDPRSDPNYLADMRRKYDEMYTAWNIRYGPKPCGALNLHGVDTVCSYQGKVVSCQSEMMPDTTATLTCINDYKNENEDESEYSEITCLREGTWDKPPFNCVPECGTEISHGRTLIVNGTTAKPGVFPWHVAIYENYTAGNYQQICGGSLISPNLIISAAHCFYDETIQSAKHVRNFAVAAGKYNRLYNWPERFVQKSLVKWINISHRYYGTPGNHARDIALVHVQTPFNLNALVRPICMDWTNIYKTEHLKTGSVGKVVGWGKTAQGNPSLVLQEINLPYVPYQQCISAVPYDFRGFVTADKFCAGYLNGSSPCNGDSGGGLGFKTGELWYLRGIVSVSPTSQDMCDSRYYTAFTDVGQFINWIREAFTA